MAMYESTAPGNGDEFGDSLRKINQAVRAFYSGASFTYLRPATSFVYKRPGGTDNYKRP